MHRHRPAARLSSLPASVVHQSTARTSWAPLQQVRWQTVTTVYSAVNDLIKRALMSAEVPSRLEPRSFGQQDNKPTACHWSTWKMPGMGLHVPDTLAPSHINTAVHQTRNCRHRGKSPKKMKYADLTLTYHFVSVAVETLGALGLGRRLTSCTNWDDRLLQ